MKREIKQNIELKADESFAAWRMKENETGK